MAVTVTQERPQMRKKNLRKKRGEGERKEELRSQDKQAHEGKKAGVGARINPHNWGYKKRGQRGLDEEGILCGGRVLILM